MTPAWKPVTIPLCLILLCFHSNVFADRNHLGFGFENEKQSVTIPFRSVKNLIILEAELDNQKKLNLILDTGIRSLVLFHKSHVPEISEQTFKLKFTGAGTKSPIPATVSINHTLRLSEDVVAYQINAVILKKSNPYLHELNGVKIHGVFGYQLFTRFQVRIDYENQLITLNEPLQGDDIPGFNSIPIQIHDTKPFVQIHALNQNKEWEQIQLLVDVGANHQMLIHNLPKTQSIIRSNLKKQKIAEGLSGTIEGRQSRLEKVLFGEDIFNNVEILIPTKNTYHQESLGVEKHGSLGSKFFQGKTIIIDYINARLHYNSGEKEAFDNSADELALDDRVGQYELDK
jgi:hypothetical protein